MSGQALTMAVSALDSLTPGDFTRENVPVIVFDMGGMASEHGVEGFISLTSFRSTPVTIDYEAGVIVVEDERSLADRASRGMPASRSASRSTPARTPSS